MKSKAEAKKANISSPFATHKTEWTCAAKMAEWINDIVHDKNLELGQAEVETKQEIGQKRVDIIIFETPKSQNALCVIEAKGPFFDVFNENLKDDARKKAHERKAKYFATTNFKSLVWWKTKEASDPTLSASQQMVNSYALSELENLDDIEQVKFKEPIQKGLESFLTKLYAVHTKKEHEPKHAIDELLILVLREKIRVLSIYYRDIIENKCHKDSSFAAALAKWFHEQGWKFSQPWQSSDFDRAAKQTAYLLINKILFYDLLQAKRPQDLDPLEIPESISKGVFLQINFQYYFSLVLKINYETIYETDFIDSIAFPDSKEIVQEVKDLVTIFKQYDFSKLGYEVIGRIFESIIPPNERHKLGQYFTSPDVVDLILSFCLHHEDDRILDPACGAGTFLVRAYQHKKMMNQYKKHEDILEGLWGNDISKLPITLSTINLAIRDLSVDKNYPNTIQEDFFAIMANPGGGFDLPDKWRKVRAKTLGVEEKEVTFPRWFDAIVGNPPYTRQEEIPEIGVNKKELINHALVDASGEKIAEIGKRAGIHAYFFVHGTKFLSEGGFFGFIVSNSWLDVDYGKGLQEFLLKNYKIVTIIESKVERWFAEADINTCIIILQKCKDNKEREDNAVRFVYLKKPLRNFIPPAQDMWEKENKRLYEIDKLKKTILSHNDFYENEDLRIFPKMQKELWEEGFDAEENKYAGAKWGKYLRAPEIFFKILEKGKDKLVPLKEIAKVRFGIKTGANEFFYLTEEEIKRRGIEKEFWMHKDDKGNWVPNYIIRSPRECKSIIVKPEDLKYRVLMIHKDKKELKDTKVLKYIQEGERKEFDKRPTCDSRERWYDLGEWKPFEILFTMYFQQSYKYHFNLNEFFVDHTLYECESGNSNLNKLITLFFNSSVAFLYPDILGRGYGGGGAPTGFMVYEVKKLPILNFPKISKKYEMKLLKLYDILSKRNISTVFEELGAYASAEISLDKVKPDRRELDKIIMGEILGLSDEEQLEVYRAVVDLVKSRIEKAKSLENNNKMVDGINITALKKSLVERVKKDLQK